MNVLKSACVLMLLGVSCIQASADVEISGAHAGIECSVCHVQGQEQESIAAAAGAPGCIHCHSGMEGIFAHAMSSRQAEQEFCARSWGRVDENFFSSNCMGCHVDSCLDCHGDGHSLKKPDTHTCQRCHNGYFVGWDYSGRAPRDDHERYQRGPQANGRHYLKMRPDVHAQAGMTCGDCHNMQSLSAGQMASRSCLDCHTPDTAVLEHGIKEHLQNMTCAACHAAWSAQEYGTFFIQAESSSNAEIFKVRSKGDGYLKSSYLKRHDIPVLGVNASGKVSPIRPQFIAYYSAMLNNEPIGEENRLLAAEWKAYTPHSIQRGGPMCDACHADARRFVLQPDERRMYLPDLDGLGLRGFWNQQGQMVHNGRFYTSAEFGNLQYKSAEYKRSYIRKWQQFSSPGADSLPHSSAQ